jgi:hypothetical protein
MNVKLYKNSAPPNKVDKSSNLSREMTIENVRFTSDGSIDILNPEVIISLSSGGNPSDIDSYVIYNYLYIPKFNRYYFIDNITTESGLVIYHCRVDSLMSHKSDILNSTQYVLRQQSKNNSPYLVDNLMPIRADHGYICKPFGNYVDDRSCGRVIMATTGKGGTPI